MDVGLILLWVLVGAVLLAIGRFLLRATLRAAGRSLARSATLRTSDPVVPGERLDLQLTLTARRALEPSAVEWELLGEEVAIRRDTTVTTYTHTFERLRIEAPPPGLWRADLPIELAGQIAVPRDAPLSFKTANHAIRWSAVARVRVPQHPDLEFSQPITVAPGNSGETREGRTRQVLEQGSLHGELVLDLRSEDGVPVAPVRGRVTGNLRVWSLTDVEGREASVRLVRLLHGSGSAEEAVFEENVLHEGDLRVGHTLSSDLDWSLPDTAEVTYAGRHVKCDWFVDVKVDRPMWTDLHLRFPLQVVGS